MQVFKLFQLWSDGDDDDGGGMHVSADVCSFSRFHVRRRHGGAITRSIKDHDARARPAASPHQKYYSTTHHQPKKAPPYM